MKTFIFDLDGTMYRDKEIIPTAKDFIDYLYEHKIPYLFLTNNAMRTPEQNTKHMLDMGYEHIEPYMFFNSSMAAAQYARSLDKGNKAFYIGQEGLKQALESQGFIISEDKPDFVFVGLDKEANYHTYSKAVDMLLAGAVLIGTNNDRILAAPGGFEMGNGSIVAMFEYCCNQISPKIGKPSSVILDLCLKHYHLSKEDVVLVGDNLETDISLGYNNNVETVFVQTGVHSVADLPKFNVKPDHILNDLSEIEIDTLL